jgi:hypothetical protein
MKLERSALDEKYIYDGQMEIVQSKLILSESDIDFKYGNIYSRVPDIDAITGETSTILKAILKTRIQSGMRKPIYFHIRYLKWRGLIWTIARYLIIICLAKMSRVKILYSCHNIYEHSWPSKKYNIMVRNFILRCSDSVVIFHPSLLNYLPEFVRNKSLVSSFGDYCEFVDSRSGQNPDFGKLYARWTEQQNLMEIPIVSVSAAKKNNYQALFDLSNLKSFPVLIVAPGQHHFPRIDKKSFLLYQDGFVEEEIKAILSRKVIGYLGHSNLSVPTSLYMYASYGIPILAIESEPLISIVAEYHNGELFHDSTSLLEGYTKILKNYDLYSGKARKFLESNSWEMAAKKHEAVFR